MEALARQRKTSQALALRAQIVPVCAAGAPVTAVAADLDVTRDTAAQTVVAVSWQTAECLADAPRRGAATITDEQAELVIAKTLAGRRPGHETHSSTGTMATATGTSQTAVSWTWRSGSSSTKSDLDAQQRPEGRRQGPRRRGPVPGSARAGAGPGGG